MRWITTDGKEYTQADYCMCGQMNTVGYCPNCSPIKIIRVPSFIVVDLGGHWEFDRKEIYKEN